MKEPKERHLVQQRSDEYHIVQLRKVVDFYAADIRGMPRLPFTGAPKYDLWYDPRSDDLIIRFRPEEGE